MAESCSLSLRSVRFFPLLSTPPHGDAVTSSSHPEHGSRWPRSSTSEGCGASQRTSGAFPTAGQKPPRSGKSSKFRQEAIFRVHRGEVHLVSCADQSQTPLGPWRERAEGAAAHPAFHCRGPLSLLDAPRTAFLCSTKCPGDKILEAYAWARRQCDEAGTVIPGFHTPVELDVLAILARRGARIIWVPARDLPQKLPAAFSTPWAENRLLIMTPFDYGKPGRPSRESCSTRNRFVLRFAPDCYIAHQAQGSALEADVAMVKTGTVK